MTGGSIAVRVKEKYKKNKNVRVDRKRIKKNNKTSWKNLMEVRNGN